MVRACNARHRFARVFGARRHLLAVHRVTANRGVNPSSGLYDPPDERDVFLLDLAIVKLTRELLVRGVVLRDHHHSRRAAVEPVHDAWAALTADSTQIGDVVQQGVDERFGGMARTWMDHHAG